MKHTHDIRHLIDQRVLLLDGAMGTSIQARGLDTVGRDRAGCLEYVNLADPEAIIEIHRGFLAAGSMGVETNSFGASRVKLAEYGLEDKTLAINRRAAELAAEAATAFSGHRWIIGSIGPTGMLPSSNDPSTGSITYEELVAVFAEQVAGLLQGGVNAISIETSQDILEVKAAIIGSREAMRSAETALPIIAHITLDPAGRMLLGTDTRSALVTLEGMDVDAVGLNCSTGPEEMRDSIRFLSAHSSRPLSCMPNMGIPENVGGRPCFPLQPEAFADAMVEFVGSFGVTIVGGCCGSTPEHIGTLARKLHTITPAQRTVTPLRALSSAISAVSLVQSPPPLIVGERLNTQGSKRMKSCLLNDDLDGIITLARTQVEHGAHALDLCVALTELDGEPERFTRVAKELALRVDAPILIDSTDDETVRRALRHYPGRIAVNSVTLENGTARIDALGETIAQYGAAVIALTIDETGMAKTCEEKTAIALRIAAILGDEYGVEPSRIIFDPLTFTLATGEEEYRRSAIETLDALERIKQSLPECLTILGISNVSFGFSRQTRQVVNSVFLYHALRKGLDLAIVNPADILPYPEIEPDGRRRAENLIFNTHEEAFQELITHFQGMKAEAPPAAAALPPADAVRANILNRRPEGIEKLLDRLLEERDAVSILNGVLLPAMKEVGDKFGTGELILPFVLQSAEVMKRAVHHLEQHLGMQAGYSKGKVILATVYGDVHDIGKNLAKTILSHNGYEVVDLGKQVPARTIVEEAERCGADAVGLSALLVSTSQQMAVIAREFHHRGMSPPIIVGGAAVTPRSARSSAVVAEGTAYPGGVFYANDAFAGLQILDSLSDPQTRADALETYRQSMQLFIERGDQDFFDQPHSPAGRSSHVDPVDPPAAPFWGIREFDSINLDEVYRRIDDTSLYRLSWGIRRMKPEQFRTMVRTEFEPMREELQAEAKREGYLLPHAVYGYFPCRADGDRLFIFDPVDHQRVRATLHFPRQRGKKLLSLPDYFRNDRIDVLPLQLVTIGSRASTVCKRLHDAGEYSRSYFLHGLSVEAAEGLARYLHEAILNELGLDPERGKRFSHGYPACPNLEDNHVYLELLEAERLLGVTLTAAHQFVPEQSTAALIVHHPQAEYFYI